MTNSVFVVMEIVDNRDGSGTEDIPSIAFNNEEDANQYMKEHHMHYILELAYRG